MHTFITDFLKPLGFAALTALSMHSCTPKADAPLLEGKINVTEPTELAIVYDYEGENIVTELTTDSTGAFTYNPALKAGEADLASSKAARRTSTSTAPGPPSRATTSTAAASTTPSTSRSRPGRSSPRPTIPSSSTNGTPTCNKPTNGRRKPSKP